MPRMSEKMSMETKVKDSKILYTGGGFPGFKRRIGMNNA